MAMATSCATLYMIGYRRVCPNFALPGRNKFGVPHIILMVTHIILMVKFGVAQEHTPAHWKHLLSQFGFELVAFLSTRSLLHWVEARPASRRDAAVSDEVAQARPIYLF